MTHLSGGTDLLASASPAQSVEPPAGDTFPDLLNDLERHPVSGDRSSVVARYQAWIERNSNASLALHAASFNLGVELAGTGDKGAAIDAYRHALALRPNFYPAALNLGTILEAAGQPEQALAVWQQALQPEETRQALHAYRERLAEANRAEQPAAASVLHVGCGAPGREKLPPMFRGANWQEIRLDIDPDVAPDFVASITDMRVIADGQVDAVYSSHNIDRLYPHDVPLALKEMRRVLKPDGFMLINLPDLQEVARHVAEGKLEDPLYISPIGPITPLDILFGHRPSLASGNAFIAHRTGFTGTTLASALIKAGFVSVIVQRNVPAFALTAVAFRLKLGAEQLARVQAHILPAADLPAVLYNAAG